MINTNKPVGTRDGHKATIISADVREDIEGITSTRLPGQTILARVEDPHEGPQLRFFFPDGRFLYSDKDDSWDLVNVVEPKVVYKTIRNRPNGGEAQFGAICCTTLEEARSLITGPSYWCGVAKITSINGKIVSLEFIPA